MPEIHDINAAARARQTAGAPPSRRPEDPPHIAHVRAHLKRLRSGMATVPDPTQVFLGPEVGEHFWELIGMRLQGHPTVVLAAVRFQRHEVPGVSHARESLAAFLASPPAPLPQRSGRGARAGEITAQLPRWHEKPSAFLARLRGGQGSQPVNLSPDLIEVAFDLRTRNPSALDAVKRRAAPLVPFLIRTTAGHILRGLSHGPDSRQESGGRFIPVTDCEQITPKGRFALPTVMLHRNFVGVSAALADERTRLAAPNWTPFLAATANRRHLLMG